MLSHRRGQSTAPSSRQDARAGPAGPDLKDAWRVKRRTDIKEELRRGPDRTLSGSIVRSTAANPIASVDSLIPALTKGCGLRTATLTMVWEVDVGGQKDLAPTDGIQTHSARHGGRGFVDGELSEAAA